MADQFQSATGNWWTSARPPAAPAAAGFDGTSCSATELACTYGWSAENMFQAAESRSCDESPVSISSGSASFFQDHLHNHHSSHAPLIAGLVQLDSAPPAAAVEFGLYSPSVEWSQAGLFGRSESGGSVLGFLREDAISRAYPHRDSGTIEPNPIYSHGSFLQDHIDVFPLLPSSAGGGGGGPPYTALSGLLEQDGGRLSTSYDDAQAMNSPLKLKLQPPPPPPQQFSNQTPFWNPTAPPAAHPNLHQERLPQQPPPPQPLQKQSSCHRNLNNIIKNSNPSGAAGSSTREKRNGSCEPSLKKPRIETPSPLPTFKVRKEKLGDRITALQQLVSPFGKTDTASVLHDATEYIKFLHDQVRVLSAPYLKSNGHQTQPVKNLSTPSKESEGLQQHKDLRSRGLCLAPISSTVAVANEMHTDFCWTPPFMGTFG